MEITVKVIAALLASVGVLSASPNQKDDEHITLALDWAMNWGEWGPQVFCPEGTFTYAFQIKVETESAVDDTAMNGIELFCHNRADVDQNDAIPGKDNDTIPGKDNDTIPGKANDTIPGKANEFTITSTVQKWGDWQGKRECQTGYLTGLRMKSEEDQGFWVDDTAANNLEMECDWSTETLDGGGDHWGYWSNWAICPHEWAICGIETRVEADSATDDTALNDVRMFCCKLNATKIL